MTATRNKRAVPAAAAIPAEFAACRDAAARLIEENDGRFRRWERRVQMNVEMRNDGFIALVYGRYRADHDCLRHALGARFIHGLAMVSRYYGLRFISISSGDLIGFEGVTWPPCGWQRPVEWQIAAELGIGWGCGNSSHHQIRLLELPLPLHGVYDIRGEKPVWLAPPLTLRTSRMSVVRQPFDAENIRQHLDACGARASNDMVNDHA